MEKNDWQNWQPTEVATLCFIIDSRGVLLIEKCRGLGAGKVNAPGGKVDPGETPLQAAIREVEEEVKVTPLDVYQVGELFFRFRDGYHLHCHVFRSGGCEGEPQSTPEAVPFWVSPEKIPYERMWSDDRFWLPLLLGGKQFLGRFVFDGDVMVSEEIKIVREEIIGGSHTSWLEF